MGRVTAVALLLAVTAASAFAADACSLTSAVSDATLTISIPNGQTTFREGEIIPIGLSFTSTAKKRYTASTASYDRSGRLNIDTFCIEPAAPDPIEDYFRSGAFIGGGLFSEQPLSAKPFTVSLELNEWLQPAPGHYRLYVVSHRVSRPANTGAENPDVDGVGVPLRSNTIDFDVINADDSWRAQQLQDATAVYEGNASPERAKAAARRLRFLNTKASTETLARLYWSLNDQPGGWDLMFGLFGSTYREEAIAAMRREIDAPDHPITGEFLNTLVTLQISSDPAWQSPAFDPAHRKQWDEFWRKWQEHRRDLMKSEFAATASALAQKTGRARAVTAKVLVGATDMLGPETASQIRTALIASWGDLPKKARPEAIEFGWDSIAGPEMLPILEDFVANPAPQLRTEEWSARNAALRHIYELDASEGRSLILRDLRNPRAQPSVSVVKLLSTVDLGPIVKDAVARIQKDDARELDYSLVELDANANSAAAIEAVFNRHIGEWACDPQDAMLRYLLRVDPSFGRKAVEASLAARKDTGCYRTLLQDLGMSLPEVEPLAMRALDDPDVEVAEDAANALGRWGTAKAEAALWARLKRFHQQWSDRERGLRVNSDYRSSTSEAKGFERTLISAIATGTNWICGPDKFERLRALASPQEQKQIDNWEKQWQSGRALIQPNWFTEAPTFDVLQYGSLDMDQFKAKLSQIPPDMALYFQIWKPGQITPPVPLERQESMFESVRDAAAAYGVVVEKKSDP